MDEDEEEGVGLTDGEIEALSQGGDRIFTLVIVRYITLHTVSNYPHPARIDYCSINPLTYRGGFL